MARSRLLSASAGVWFALGVCVVTSVCATSRAADVILNEYNAVGGNNLLDNDGSDPIFGQVPGNGGDWFELVVITDHLDLRGWKLEWQEDGGVVGGGTEGTLTLTSDPLWSDLRAGTIVTFGESDFDRGGRNTEVSYDPTDPLAGDWWIHINTLVGEIACVGGDYPGEDCGPGTTVDCTLGGGSCVDSEVPQTQYVTTTTTSGSGPGHFSVNNDDWQLTVRDAADALIFGPAGEGIPASDPGVNATEVFKLEEDPSASVDPVTSIYNDGTSSTFGQPNIFDAGTKTQDFRALRGAPVVASESPLRNSVITALASVSVTFTESVSGVVAGDLTVNGSAATGVTGTAAGPYEFTGFTQPTEGLVTVVLAAGSIQDDDTHPFTGDAWGYTFNLPNVIINEIHYHPSVAAVDPLDNEEDLQFLELYNAESTTVDLAGWTISDGVDFTFPAATTLGPGEYMVLAEDAAFLLAHITTIPGGVQVLQWDGGNLANGGERVAISDSLGNVVDEVTYGEGGEWPPEADGDGPSLELINPVLPNQYGGAWRASVGINGTPGEQNSTWQADPAPVIAHPIHSPAIPAANQAVTITATVVDDASTPTVTLHYRQDQWPTIAYTSVPMLDDGLSGDGVAGDSVYGVIVPGLADGQRLDFAITASDGVNPQSVSPTGHDDFAAGGHPSQTYLCKFSNAVSPSDYPLYHMITTQWTRNQQDVHDKTEYDATFVRCESAENCEIFYNVIERYRGRTSLNQHPHSFKVTFNAGQPILSEMGFEIRRMNLLAQQAARQTLGYILFREISHAPLTQLVRFNTNPLSHGGTQNFIYTNAERIDGDFIESQDGFITPTRFPDRCEDSGDLCDDDADCPPGESCVATDTGNLYRGRYNAGLQWLGPDVSNGYRTILYEKESNEDEDDWTDLINLCDALTCSSSDGGSLCTENTYDGVYPDLIESMVDADQWTRWFALHNLIVNTEGGIYRDTGDDFFIYFPPTTDGIVFLPWDLDAFFGSDYNQTIWRTEVDAVERFLEHNAFAGRFVGALCDMMDGLFTQAAMDARIDALPDDLFPTGTPQGNGPQTKAAMKQWVADRRVSVANQITSTTTLVGVPASPYTDANPVIALSGALNQCWTHEVRVSGLPATFSVYNAAWSHNYTLAPGNNLIVVQVLDHTGAVIETVQDTVFYAPGGIPEYSLKVTAPSRMVSDKTLTLKAEILDSLGRIDWQTWTALGTVSARRVSDQSVVPTSITIFETNGAGTGGGTPPADSIRFYNGVGSVSITLDDPGSVAGEDIEVIVEYNGLTASKVVTVLDNQPGLFRPLSGTLSGSDLAWGPGDGVIHLTGSVTVPGGSRLTIDPGTLIMVDPGPFGDGTAISATTGPGTGEGRCDGDAAMCINDSECVGHGGSENCIAYAVDARGTEDEPVFFFPSSGAAGLTLPQTQQNNPDSWRGFVHSGSGWSEYSYTFVTGAGNGPTGGHPRAAVIRMENAHSVALDNSLVTDSPGKIIHLVGGGTFEAKWSLVSRVGYGGEFLGAGHTLRIEDSWFTRIGYGPESLDLDGDIFHLDNGSSDQLIERSVLADCGDDMMDHSGANPVVRNTLVWDADDKCVSLSGGGGITFYNVLVFGMPLGINGAGGNVTYSTIASTGNAMGPPVSVQRSILWPRSTDTCAADVDYTDVGDPADLGCGDGNLSQDPLFIDAWPGGHDYNLQPGSPAASAGPDGGRIGWLGFPGGSSCTVDTDCDDANACTLDTCAVGACSYIPIPGCAPCQTSADCEDGDPCTVDTCLAGGTCENLAGNDGAPCDDGWDCTIDDQCGAGACAGTESCPQGQHCDANGNCTTGPVQVVFQQGATYTGTQDTFIKEEPTEADLTHGSLADTCPGTAPGPCDNFEWDLEDPAPYSNIGLIRFDDIVGPAVDQIPQGAAVVSATLTLTVYDPSVAPPADIHVSLVDWDQTTATWNNFGGEAGVQPDELGADVGDAPITNGTHVIDITSTVQGWVTDPAGNFGLIVMPNSNNGVVVRSSEYSVPAERPLLTVEILPVGCDSDDDCNDGNPCTDDTCPVDECVFTPNDANSCEDGLFCNGAETCNAGVCDPGSDPCPGQMCDEGPDLCVECLLDAHCDDGVPCTTDTCAAGICVFTNDDGNSCEDGLFCNGSESCNAGICDPGTPPDCASSGQLCSEPLDACVDCLSDVDCGVGEVCNLATGLCEIPPDLQPGDVIIAGFNPTDNNNEWIELFNTTDQTISLEGMTLVARVDVQPDGVLDDDWTLSANLTGLSIAPHSFFLIGEGTNGGDIALATGGIDLSTGEMGVDERALSLELTVGGVHMDYVLYGNHDGSDSTAIPPGDIPWDGVTFPRTEVIRTTGTATGFNEGTTQRVSAEDLYAGYDVEGFYVEDVPAGVWTSDHSGSGPWTLPRDSSTPPVPPPSQPCTSDTECDDGLHCNGVETCDIGGTGLCVAGTPVVCDDSVSCTEDTCNDTTDQCDYTPNDALCSDGNVCTDDTCNPLSGCQYANNTAPCDDGDACTENDTCGGGSCQPGSAVDCDDGVACTDDSCDPGLGCLNVDNCTGGLVCNLTTGFCETPPDVPPLPIVLGDEWRYRVNTADEPDPAWRDRGFDDSSWAAGPGGLCYGPDCPADCNTALAGMQNVTATTYYRREFWVANPAAVESLTLEVTYDDAFVAFINGVEVARSNVWGDCSVTSTTTCQSDGDCPGGETCLLPTYDRLAGDPPGNGTDNHECNTGGPAGPGGYEVFDLSASISQLVAGVNVIAIQGHNLTLGSSDFVQSALLSSVEDTSCTQDADCVDGLYCNGAETCNLGTGLCEAGTPVDCDDGVACTADTCNEGTDSCDNSPDNLLCDDGIACTVDTCDPLAGCEYENQCVPVVDAVGPRYLAVTPPAGLPSVALQVDSASLGCLPQYVDATGHLVGLPVFLDSATWGTVYVGDAAIAPSTDYDVRTDVRDSADPENLSPTATATTWLWGDSTDDLLVDMFDILCVLRGFQGRYYPLDPDARCSLYADDLMGVGEVPDRAIDLLDITGVLDAFEGLAYPDADPCAKSGGGTAMAAPAGPIIISPSRVTVAPGDSVDLNFFADGAEDLRGYQLAVEASGGQRGQLTVDSFDFDVARPDYVFAGLTAYSVGDVAGGRLAGAVVGGGVFADKGVYLGTVRLRASRNALGTFTVSLATDARSMLVNTAGQVAGIESGPAAEVRVQLMPAQQLTPAPGDAVPVPFDRPLAGPKGP